MYDILQLNDMLLPELLDIAEQLNITGAKNSINRASFTKYWMARLYRPAKQRMTLRKRMPVPANPSL
jgi:hypothetical protein